MRIPGAGRITTPLVVAFSALVYVACDEGPTAPTIEDVAVTSPIGGVMAAGRTGELSATARDGSAVVTDRTFSWESSNPPVAAVSAAGVVEGRSPGTAVITATTGGVTGSLELRVVAADLDGIARLLDDPYTVGLVGALTSSAEDQARAELEACAAALRDGHVLALDECLNAIPAVSSSNATDAALLTILGFITDHAGALLGL